MVKEWKNVEEFYEVMSRLRACRVSLVSALLHSNTASVQKSMECLQWVQNVIRSSCADTEYTIRLSSDEGKTILLNVKDEVLGVEKDVHFVQAIQAANSTEFVDILGRYHPVSVEKFHQEVSDLEEMLARIIPAGLEMLITDWDGTMKTYCSNYRTSVQPAYSAYWLTMFAKHCTGLTAVLTAGPLRDHGILDLIAVPIEESEVMFGGSWGREWLINKRRCVDRETIPAHGEEYLNKLTACLLKEINDHTQFHRFLWTGSGFQRKVDRITIGVQTVTNDVSEKEAADFLSIILAILKRVDPNDQYFLTHQEKLDVEIILKTPGQLHSWSKADGVSLLLRETGRSISSGLVWICGDTESDLPMLEFALANNPNKTYATFVNPTEALRKKVSALMSAERYQFVGCPEVLHAAIESVLRKRGLKTI